MSFLNLNRVSYIRLVDMVDERVIADYRAYKSWGILNSKNPSNYPQKKALRERERENKNKTQTLLYRPCQATGIAGIVGTGQGKGVVVVVLL